MLSPVAVRVFGEQQQMQRLIGKQLVCFVTLLKLHRFVTDAQRTHFEFAEVFVGRRIDGGEQRQKK